MKNKYILAIAKGGADNLKLVEDDMPEPGQGQVRVKMLAAGVSSADVLLREGVYPVKPPSFPFIIGYDLVGTIDKCGEGATKFKAGQTVAALTKIGACALYTCLPEEDLVILPAGVEPTQAVAVILNYLTAYQIMHRVAQVKEGETVLIYAAAGGVGTAFIDLGKLAGLKMYGTASKKKHEKLIEMGVTPIDYRNDNVEEKIQSITGGEGVDIVFDAIGGENCFRAYPVVKEGGRLVSFGASFALAGNDPQISEVYFWWRASMALNFISNSKKVLTYAISSYKEENHNCYLEDLEQILNLLAEKKINPLIDRTMPLHETATAHKLLDSKSVVGKIVLVP